MSASCSFFPTQLSFVRPFTRKIRVSAGLRSHVQLRSYFQTLDSFPKPPSIKRKINCFRKDGFSPDTCNSEFVGSILPDEVVEPKIDKPITEKRDWTKGFQEAADALVGAIGKPWTVPWTMETILKVTLLWTASFWIIGSWAVPLAAHLMGFSKLSLTYRGQALFSLVTDLADGLVGAAILYRSLSPFFPLPSDWFQFSFNIKWVPDIVLAVLMFPLVNYLSRLNLNLVPQSSAVTLSGVERCIAARDPVAMALYGTVVAVCCPIWEEVMFRGFLLASLTRYMPVWLSVAVSSAAFAVVHLNVQRMLPLMVLGGVMGFVFARSRNLLPCMIVHSLWNGFVFWDLMM